jgi:two-component system, OmpR family, response regulator MtrA
MANILVAEDDSDLRLLVSLKLESAGHQVVSVEDGSAAARHCRSMRPDLVILDLMMPGMSGLEVCRFIRADPELTATPVILLTARAQAADIEAGKAAGVDEYLTKPFSPRELAGRVDSLLGVAG